jgi:hypothetical protein
VEDIYAEGGGVTLDRGGNVHRLEGVRELEDELGRFREVLYLAWGSGRGGLSGGCERDRKVGREYVM